MDAAGFREAERALWASVGVTPTEHRVTLPLTGTELRVQIVGDGTPTLFLHGVPNAGSTWAPVVADLTGVRAIMVDRPGTGLSAPLPRPLDAESLAGFADRFAIDVLDALSIPRAHLVASSFGGYLALRSAAAAPDRFERMVLLGTPAFVPGGRTPALLRMLATPIHRLLPKLPPSDRNTLRSLRQIGHDATIDAGGLPAPLLRWFSSLQSHTETFLHDGRMIRQLVSPWRGAKPSLTLPDPLLSRVRTPTLVVWGDHDPFGDHDVAQGLVRLLADATLETVPDAGHLPWLDAPRRISGLVSAHLAHRVDIDTAT